MEITAKKGTFGFPFYFNLNKYIYEIKGKIVRLFELINVEKTFQNVDDKLHARLIINERILMIDGVKVVMNPNHTNLMNLINQTEYKEIRGLYDGEDFFFWDAGKLIHDSMAPKLGMISYTRLEANNSSKGFDINVIDDNIPEIWDNLYFQKLIKYIHKPFELEIW